MLNKSYKHSEVYKHKMMNVMRKDVNLILIFSWKVGFDAGSKLFLKNVYMFLLKISTDFAL